MELGLTSVSLLDRSWEEALDTLQRHGLRYVEADAGGHVPKGHFDPKGLIGDDEALKRFEDALISREITIAAFGCYGNPIHPDSARAATHHEDFVATCELAEKLSVNRVAVISGCPAGGPDDRAPNWIVNSIFPDFRNAYRWQWEERLIPYWQEAASIAAAHGVSICMEPHGGDMVYNTQTLLRLREAVGTEIGAHVDPSHLFWMGIDPLQMIRDVQDCVYLVHAKDVAFDHEQVRRQGVAPACDYADWEGRSWIYRAVGQGHDGLFWRRFITELRRAGYDDVVVIEIEEPFLAVDDAIAASLATLRPAVPAEPMPRGDWFDSYEWDPADVTEQ